MMSERWVWPVCVAHASHGPEVVNVTPCVVGLSPTPSMTMITSMTSSPVSSHNDRRRNIETTTTTKVVEAGNSSSSSSSNSNVESQANSSCQSCSSVRAVGGIDVDRILRGESSPAATPATRRPIKLQRPEVLLADLPVVWPVSSPTTAVWIPASIGTHASAITTTRHSVSVTSSADCSRIITSALTTKSTPTVVSYDTRRHHEADEYNGSRQIGGGNVWNDDENDDDDETKLTDRDIVEVRENWMTESHGTSSDRRRKSEGSDEKQSTEEDNANNGNGTWYEVFDVVARQDDWMTCTTVFAVHLSYDGLRFAAMMWLSEAGRQFQMTQISLVWLASLYHAISNTVVGSLRSTDAQSSLLVRRPAVLCTVGLLTVASGLVAVAAMPPWSPCLAAGLVAVAVGSSLATAVSDCVLVGRCYARRRYLQTPSGGGLLADDDDKMADESDAENGITFGGGTNRCHDWLAVMRLGAGGVGMALITVLVDQILACVYTFIHRIANSILVDGCFFRNTTWFRAMQALTGLISVPVVLAVILHRSVASTIATQSPDRRRPQNPHPPADRQSSEGIPTGPGVAHDVISPLRIRIVQLTVLCAAATSFGIYVPFLLLPGEALDYNMSNSSVALIMVLMGVAYSFGCLLAGAILVSFNRSRPATSTECFIARRQFYQATSCACAAAIMLFAGAEGFADRALFAGIYGLLAGTSQYSLDAFWREHGTSVMTSHTGGGGMIPDYVVLAQVFPSLIGPPVVAHINGIRQGIGYVIAGFVMLIGTGSMFFAPCAMTATSSPTAVVDNETDCHRQQVDDFHLLPDDHCRHRRQKQGTDDCENDVSNNAYFRSSPTSGNRALHIPTGNQSSSISVARDNFRLLEFQSAPTNLTARSGTWPTVAAITSPVTEVASPNTECFDKVGVVSEMQSPISSVDKVADFLRRKCAAGRIKSTSYAVPFWSRGLNENDRRDTYANFEDNEMSLYVGERV